MMKFIKSGEILQVSGAATSNTLLSRARTLINCKKWATAITKRMR